MTAGLFWTACAQAAPTTQVIGKVSMPGGGRGWELDKLVAYLVPDAEVGELPVPKARPKVSQKNAAFDPYLLVMVKGQTVDFFNDDRIDHNVFSLSKAQRFDLGVYPQGQAKSVTFEREGPVLIFCSVHEFMNAVVFVAPNALHAVADRSGRFTIRGVPPGRYRLRTWHPALPAGVEYVAVLEVEAVAGVPVRVDVPLSMLRLPGSAGP